MKYMRQVHGSALWAEITPGELFCYLDEEKFPLTEKDVMSNLQNGETIETHAANYRSIADEDDVWKEIESKCTLFILFAMDKYGMDELDAKILLRDELNFLTKGRFPV